MNRTILIVLLCLLAFEPARILGQSNDAMYRIKYKGKSFIGKAMAWDGSELMLLRRNGKLSMLPLKDQKKLERVSNRFHPYSFSDLRARLEREFGSKYQITQTENYLVVHPYGNADIWAKPFQDLYYRFEVYFASRGVKLTQPEFPLVAVVYRSREEFDRQLIRYQSYQPNIIGFYSLTSNRIITYDQSAAKGGRRQASLANNSTIIHEATHQVAFNTGVHSRYVPQIRWLSEGLATYFEAKGVHHSAYYSQIKDRINRESLMLLKAMYKRKRVKGTMAKLIVSDDIFRSEPELAYAVSWGMAFYFNEKMPSQFRSFLERDGNRKNFSGYSSSQRARDFAKAFGGSIAAHEAKMKSYFAKLSVPKE